MIKLSLERVLHEADKIRFKIDAGELIEGCYMSAIQTPVMEAWSVAEEITELGQLSTEENEKLFSILDDSLQSQLQSSKYDDFDLIYEYFLQVINKKS